MQFKMELKTNEVVKSHNPYFSRRFFAIIFFKNIKIFLIGHNPYFSRRFFAIKFCFELVPFLK